MVGDQWHEGTGALEGGGPRTPPTIEKSGGKN